MPGDIIEITPEPDPRTKSQPAAFAGQHTEIRADITSQNSEVRSSRSASSIFSLVSGFAPTIGWC
jgi:hypothetical protein